MLNFFFPAAMCRKKIKIRCGIKPEWNKLCVRVRECERESAEYISKKKLLPHTAYFYSNICLWSYFSAV